MNQLEDVASQVVAFATGKNPQAERTTTIIKTCIEMKNLKLHDVINSVRLEWNRPFNNFEISFIEINYTETLLKIWLKESFVKAFSYLEQPDSRSKTPSLLNELHSLENFSKLLPGTLVHKWCEGDPFNLIKEQSKLFKQTNNNHLLLSYLNQFKTTCIDKIYHLCLANESETQLYFISALKNFLTFINLHPEPWTDQAPNRKRNNSLRKACFGKISKSKNRTVELDIQGDIENEQIYGRKLVELLIEHFCSVASHKSMPKDSAFLQLLQRLQISIESLNEQFWTPQFQLLTKDICKRLLLPLFPTFKESMEGCRRVLNVEGTTIRISDIKTKIVEKMKQMKAEEIQIVGLAAVHIDSDLENEDWHGINVAVLTDQLFVDGTVCWDLSGLDDDPKPKAAKETKNDGHVDGLAGEHGDPGQSGGNVHVNYNKIFNSGNWTIVSNGGRGQGGQNGQDGKDGKNGKDATRLQPSKKQFKEIFSPLISSTKFIGKKYILEIHKEMEIILNKFFGIGIQSCKSKPSTGSNFYFHTFHPVQGVSITAARKKNSSLILWKGEKGEWPMGGQGGMGGKGGQGGFGGAIIVEKLKHDEEKPLDQSEIQVDHQQTNTEENVTIISIRGKSGEDGKHGQGGKSGQRGKSIGDVGYIDNLNDNCKSWKRGPNYFGFDTKANFEIRDITNNDLSSFIQPYTKCKLDVDELSKELYALYPIEYTFSLKIMQTLNTTKGRQRVAIPEALKKKAITFQSLVHHLNHIIDRYNSVLRLNNLVANKKTMNIKETVRQVMKKHRAVGDGLLFLNHSKFEQILHQKSIESRRVWDNIRSKESSEKFDIGYICSQPDIEKDIKVMESLDKQSYSSDYRAKYLEDCLQQVSDYLEPQPTKDEGSSILHAAYGQLKNGVYVCDNVNELRKQIHSRVLCSTTSSKEMIKDFILLDSSRQEIQQSYFNHVTNFWQKIRDNQEALIVEIKKQDNEFMVEQLGFNLQTQEDKVIHLLLRRCLGAQDISDIDYKTNKMTKLKLNESKSETLKDLLIQLNKEFDWSNQKWKDECSQAIMSKQLTMTELRAIKHDNINLIVSYDNVGRRSGIDNDDDINECETLTFKCIKRTLQLPTETELILINRDNKGIWQRLECHPKIQKYLDGRMVQIKKTFEFYYGGAKSVFKDGKALSTRRPITTPTTDELKAHRDLLKWLKDYTTECNSTIMKQITMSVQIFNPEYGCTPGELSRLLLNHFRIFNIKHPVKEILESNSVNLLAEDVGWLAQRVVDYDSRNIDSIVYLFIVAYLNPHSWKYEFVLLEVEERIKEVLDLEERAKWRRNLFKLGDNILSVFQQRLHAAGKPGSLNLDLQKLKRTLELLADHQVDLTKKDVERLGHLSLNDWFYELKSKMWQKLIGPLLTEEKKKEAVYILQELENKKGERFIHQVITEGNNIFDQLKNYLYKDGCSLQTRLKKNGGEWTLGTVIEMIKIERGNNTSESVANTLDYVKTSLETIENKLQEKENKYLENEIKKWLINFISTLNSKMIFTENKDNKDSSVGGKSINCTKDIEEFLYYYIRAVKLKMDILLRETQRVAIMTLLLNGNNTLAQVSTGEGKSLIVAGLAIFHALRGKKVDIITSNNVLAIRDSSKLIKDGGLRELYGLFNVNVSHNCSENKEGRVEAYGSNVVYGELSNFQRDYLLDTFYGENIRGDRTFDCVIVDEVDCMLLDRGNNMLYLSHDIPGMELLESLYVFIWEKIRTTEDSLDAIKSTILYDLYGEIKKEDLASILGLTMENDKDSAKLWTHLIEQKVINQNGRLLIENLKELTEINYTPELNSKLVFFFRKVFQRKRNIYIPQHLLAFVDRHLDTFLDNAVKALQLNVDEDYVVDREQNGSKLNPQIIIIDCNTGTDQTMSQWDEGLHQFLQLKERCRLTLQSLKSVFISNVTYIKRYEKLYGMTGTLGSQPEREFLKEMYECDYFTVPTARPKIFDFRPAKVVKTQNEWLRDIINETKEIAVNEKRSLVIFCRTVKDVNFIHKKLAEEFNDQIQIQSYMRDYQEFAFGGDKEMGIGQVIVATNLAGRGTDIKISDDLRKHGGLHIYLTYLPENIRVEEQAFGRAGRKGDNGSGRLILWEPDDAGRMDEEWDNGKIFDIKEKKIEKNDNGFLDFWANFQPKLKKQEICFDRFRQNYEKLQSTVSDDQKEAAIICSSVLDQWALWVDQVDFGQGFKSQSTKSLLEQLNKEIINNMTKGKIALMKWMTPDRSIVLAKHLTISHEDKKKNLIKKEENGHISLETLLNCWIM